MAERMTARKRQALEMRSRIQSAALDLFDKEGFENVSVEEIAQAAGCSVGNIYHYFKSKDELAIQVTSHVDDAYRELETGYLSDTAHSAREKLLDFVGRSLEISVSDPVLYKAFIHGLRYPEQRVLQKTTAASISVYCWSLSPCARRRAVFTPPTTRIRWWRSWWCCTGAHCSSGAFMRAALTCPSWPPHGPSAAAGPSLCRLTNKNGVLLHFSWKKNALQFAYATRIMNKKILKGVSKMKFRILNNKISAPAVFIFVFPF